VRRLFVGYKVEVKLRHFLIAASVDKQTVASLIESQLLHQVLCHPHNLLHESAFFIDVQEASDRALGHYQDVHLVAGLRVTERDDRRGFVELADR